MTLERCLNGDSLGDEFLKSQLGEEGAEMYLSNRINQTVSEEIIQQLNIRAKESNNPILKQNLQEFQEDCKRSAYDPEKYFLAGQEGVLRIYRKDSGEPVAYIEYTLDHPNFLGEIFIQSGEVELEERRKGLMTRLCSKLEEQAKKMGKKMIYANIDAETEDMQCILRSLGYEPLGKEEYESANIDRYLWGKSL